MDAPLPFFRRWSLSALVFLAAFALPAAAAHAAEPSPEVLAKITKLNKKAVEAYQKEDFDSAKDLLKQALEACNQNHLEHHPITARTEIHIGVLLIGGLKQHDAGIKHFQKALQIQADIQLTKSLVTPELQDAFEEAVLGAGGGQDGEGGGTKRRGGGDEGGGAGPSGEGGDGAGGDDDRQPARKKVAPPIKKKPPKKHGDEEGDEEGDEGDEGGGTKGNLYFSLTLGSGFGIASGSGETTPASTPAHKLSSPGFALAQAGHISPEVGYFVKPNLLLSLQGRYQIVSGTTAGAGGTAQTSALAAFLKGTLVAGDEGFHPFFSIAVGGGYIRHAVQFSHGTGCGPCVDTFKGGPFLVGPGAGIMYDLGSTLALLVQVNSQLGLPNFTFNVDGQVGAAARF